MKVLVACERFGIVRDAFIRRGHDAISCDLVPASGPHIVADVRTVLHLRWDMMLAFPGRSKKTDEAVEFFVELFTCDIPKIAIENPIGCLSTRFRKPDQIIQPWMFGEDASKATCIWLKNLPPLKPTNVLAGGRTQRRANQTASGQNRLGPSRERAMLRAKTYPGVVDAFAEQWG